MGDYDGDYGNNSNSGGIIGTIISILILAAIWPYLLALLGLWIAYMAVLAILEWISQNPWLTVVIVMGLVATWAIFYFGLMPKAWRWLVAPLGFRPTEVNLAQNFNRKFIPSTNLYCYWCTKKLGLDAWEKGGKYYCEQCQDIKPEM